MSSSGTNSSPSDPIAELLARAASTAYCRPALRALGAELPTEDAVLRTALETAAEERDADAFSHLYVAALLAHRPIPAKVLELGAVLLPDGVLLMNTALRLEGDVAGALEVAIRSGRMSSERDAGALLSAWLDYERREEPAPPEFLALTRKICRETVRCNRLIPRIVLDFIPALSGDPVVGRIFEIEGSDDLPATGQSLSRIRKQATGPGWGSGIPSSPVVETALASGATVKRAIPKAGRNDPCPCGSGKKFKRCCFGKTSSGEQYEVGGVTISEAAARPELVLTLERIDTMRSYELYALKPSRLIPELAVQVAFRLALYQEIPRSIEVLKSSPPEAFPVHILDQIAYEFFKAQDSEALRWFFDWAPESIQPFFEMEVLLSSPEERLQMLLQKARDAFEDERNGNSSARILFTELAGGALLTDPALGIIVARGTLPVCGWIHQDGLLEEIEDARDLLGLNDDDPAGEMLDIEDRTSRHESRHALELEKAREETSQRVGKRDSEIKSLKTQIDSLQETLEDHENAASRTEPTGDESIVRSKDPGTPSPAEIHELRDRLRRLKGNLKAEHEERNLAMRELRTAQDQLRRSAREKNEAQEDENSANIRGESGDLAASGVEWERQALRIPEYGPAFLEALHKHPRHAAATALGLIGRLAGGDPSAWKPVRALKQRSGTLRARVAGDYRLLFETAPPNTLRIIDLIPRRDLERWLASSKH